jgi:UcrQ family
VVPPFVAAYMAMDWAIKRNEYLNSKEGRMLEGQSLPSISRFSIANAPKARNKAGKQQRGVVHYVTLDKGVFNDIRIHPLLDHCQADVLAISRA